MHVYLNCSSQVKRTRDLILLYHQSVSMTKQWQTPRLCQAICFGENGPEHNAAHVERLRKALYSDGPLNVHSVTLRPAPALFDWIPQAIQDWQRYIVPMATFWDIWYGGLLYDFIKPLQISFSSKMHSGDLFFLFLCAAWFTCCLLCI